MSKKYRNPDTGEIYSQPEQPAKGRIQAHWSDEQIQSHFGATPFDEFSQMPKVGTDYDPDTHTVKRGEIVDNVQQWDIVERPSEEKEHIRVRNTKQIERDKIIELINNVDPPADTSNWQEKSQKWNAVYTELVEKKADDDILTDQEQVMLDAVKTLLGKIKQVIKASDEIEATPGEDPKTSTKWP